MKKKDTLFVGLMLFSMFFGAGNLIFPPFLGMGSGTSFWPAITGFIITAVGLPLLVLMATALVKDGVNTLGSRVHPWFATIFTIVVYLSIGPFLAIPRNANVAFEMGIKPFLGTISVSGQVPLSSFSVVFFLLVYLLSLNPSKVVDYMGRFITPVLLLSIVILCVTGFLNLNQPLKAPTETYQTASLFKGFIDGYSTMDALAALAFGIVIITALKQKGISDKKQVTLYTLKTGVIAGGALALVYIGIGLLGAKMAGYGTYENGTDVLSSAATILLGFGGKILLGVIFTLACFTTCVGLTIACGQYFSKIASILSYRMVVTLVTVVSFSIATLGLNQILKVSVPFLVMAYPLTIVLVSLAFLHRFFSGSQKVYACAMALTGIVSLYDGLKLFGLKWGLLESWMDTLPLASVGLGWVVPAVAGGLVGIFWEKLSRLTSSSKAVELKKAS
ncbi:branched-chain amino acid transport system II carrier protein [Neobacillus vireti]|uniref:Branched-chain amino acid transport system carrier protein n=1 Tax=Neobacillus vireti LMG 21834 TaxID=1131730 RepID=A0AB94IUF8_9BACI|nr:branched-chain amino acid transport system II carrier protein [Neobacillus vireti]ETI70603.1 branched-chain amino acid transport system II carrier protein [Neobacillus vireti LMG 21834]KLT15321.1 branched-chain amino acid transporter [Neobacillus vireti]